MILNAKIRVSEFALIQNSKERPEMSSGELSFGHNRLEATAGNAAAGADLDPRLEYAIQQSRDRLLGLQQPGGYWCAELQGDTILESEYILLLAFLGKGQTERAKESAAYILDQQGEHGGWSMFPGGPIEVSGSVKAYLALKITGHSSDASYMLRARDASTIYSNMPDTLERDTKNWRMQSRVHLALGVIGLVAAAVLIYPKAVRVAGGDMSVLGRGAVANLALVFGSIMFLRNARFFRRKAQPR